MRFYFVATLPDIPRMTIAGERSMHEAKPLPRTEVDARVASHPPVPPGH